MAEQSWDTKLNEKTTAILICMHTMREHGKWGSQWFPHHPFPSVWLDVKWEIPEYLLCQLCNCVKRGRQLATPSPHQPHSDPNPERYATALPLNTDLFLTLCVWACRVLTLLQTHRACMEVGSRWSFCVITGHRGQQPCYWCRSTFLYKCIINSVYESLKTDGEHVKNKCN